MLMDRENIQWFIVDVTTLGNARVTEKELKKVEKYQDLSQELAKALDYQGDCCLCGDWCTGDCIWKASQVSEDDWSDKSQQR